jgi:uncharacterized protein YueI
MKVDLQHLMQEFGIDKMSEEQQKLFMGRILEAVHIRVGLRMAQVISDEDAKRIEQLDQEHGEHALHEIEKIYPDFRKVYQEEVDNISEEMRALRPAQH